MKRLASYWHSLKTRVTLLSLAVFLIGIWSLTYYAGRMLRLDMERLLGEQQFSTASLLARSINRELELRLKALQGTADGITEATFADPAALQTFLDERLNLKILFNGGFFAVSPDGIGVADTPRSTGRVGMSVADRRWVKEALAGKPSIGTPVVGQRLKVPVFTIAAPIRDRQGAVIGVLAGVIDLSKPNILDEITVNRYAKTGDYFLVSGKDRLVVTSSDKRRVMQPLPPPGVNPGIDRNVGGFEGYAILVNPMGVEQLAATKKVPVADWFLAVALPTADAFAPVHDMQKRMVLAALLLTVLVGVLTWRIMGWQLSPMLAAVGVLSRLPDRNQSVAPLPVTRQDEVGHLIEAFNGLLATLAARESELKLSELGLKQNHEMLLTILNGLDANVYVADMESYQLLFVNEFIKGRFGDVVGQPCWRVMQAGQSGPCPFCTNDRLVDPDGNPAGTYRWEFQNTLNGNWYDVRDRAIQWVDGRLVRLEIATDITERKKAEEDKLALEKQLLHSQKMESLGALTGGVAHDFNNILMIIMGHCSLAKMDPAHLESSIEQIEHAAERAAELCRQMLAYAGKSRLVREQVNLRSLVHDMVGMLRSTIGQNVLMTERLTEELPSIEADASQLRQVVMNLISNASEAIGKAQGLVRVSLDKVQLSPEQTERDYSGKVIPAGCYACLEVADNGCGMTDEARRRIFEPFFSTKFAGRGLGMSAVQGIVTAEGGAIQLFSREGEGATFRIFLPLPVAASAPPEDRLLSGPDPHSGQQGTVLLVDDEEQVMAIATSMLEAMGFSVIPAADGKEALELYQEHAGRITLVFTDLGMPVMDGYQLLRELQKLDPDLPVIVSSGFGEVEVVSRIGSTHIAAVINKPYRYEQMREVVGRVLKR